MNVMGPGTKLLFCEGDPGSYDYGLLSRLLVGRSPSSAIAPLGGKQGIRSFVRGRLSAYPDQKQPDYVVFRDRDFDAEPPPSEVLIPLYQDRPVFLSHRAAVENYLLNSALIHQYWEECATRGPAWQHGNSPGEDDLDSWMRQAAMEIKCYQAVRWALASVKPPDRWPEVRSTWTEGSGYLPPSLAEDDCLRRARRLVTDFRNETSEVTEERLLAHCERFSEQFSHAGFFEDGSFLVWFHGKDLRKAMQRLRPGSISLEHFCR